MDIKFKNCWVGLLSKDSGGGFVTKWYLTLGTPWTLPGSSVHGISEARILEWVAISFSISLFKMEIEPKNKHHNDVE